VNSPEHGYKKDYSRPGQDTDETKERKRQLVQDLEHLHGPEDVACGPEDLVVLCLARDGRPYVRTFLDHHFSLGAKHVFFLDNGSVDGTIEALAENENATVLRSTLPFKNYKFAMKQYLVERFGQGRWSVYVDIDELFDYPYSDVMDLGSLLGYLNENGYTAVMAHALDMFPEEPLKTGYSAEALDQEELDTWEHRFYDLSNIQEHEYESHNAHGPGNVVSNAGIKVLSGGIRKTVFGYNGTLTRHPLVFLDGKVRPVDGHLHRVSEARVADFACVLFHYKFLKRLYEQSVQAAREENYFKGSHAYKKYLKTLQKNPSVRLKLDTAKELRSVNDLVRDGFLGVSEDYMLKVHREEDRVLSRLTPQHSPYRLAGIFLEARAEAWSRRRESAPLEERLRDLENELERERENTARLGVEKREALSRKNRLERRLEGIKSSRSWRVFTVAAKLRNRILGTRRG
jgi:hypothetical protein